MIICGLGAEPPAETTLESLQALAGCAVVHTDLASAKRRAWLAGYCRKVVRGDADQAVADAKAGKAVGVAVWGHPQFCGTLAREVQQKARAAGVAVRVLGAVSPVGSVFARSVSFLGGDYGYQGIQGLELPALLADPSLIEPALPVVVYSQEGGDWGKAGRALSAHYKEARVFARGKERKLPLAKLGAIKGGALVLVSPS